MSIQRRLTTLFFATFILSFGWFAFVVYQLPQSLLGEIDNELDNLAQRILEDSVLAGRLDVGSFRMEHPLAAATTFIMTVDLDGDITTKTGNLSDVYQPLDPDGLSGRYRAGTRQFGKQSIRVVTIPIVTEFEDGTNHLTGYLQVGRVVNDYEAYIKLRQLSLYIAGAALSIALLVLYLLLPRTMAPIERITKVAQQITSANDLKRRIPSEGLSDEVGKLTFVFNQLLARIEHLFQTRQRLLADVSHELRTPLTTIRGNVDLLRYIGSADTESLDAIEAETKRMTRLVNDLLSLARADGGGIPIRQEPVDLDTVFLDVYEQIGALRRPVRMIVKEVAQIQVLGDPDRLKQLLLNLVDNATKYTPAGGTVTLSLSLQKGKVCFLVSDTGVGIPPQDIDRIFERFYRLDKARSRDMGGSGLGLSIVKSIVIAHNGNIKVESEPGKGSTFIVTLPQHKKKVSQSPK